MRCTVSTFIYNCIIKQKLDIKRLLCLTNYSQRNAATLQPIAQKRIKTSLYNASYHCLAAKVCIFSLALTDGVEPLV